MAAPRAGCRSPRSAAWASAVSSRGVPRTLEAAAPCPPSWGEARSLHAEITI